MDNLSHLITFLKSCILPLATMDTKYKDTLPKLVKELPFETFSDDDYATAVDAVSKRTRKSKTTKIGKNGLYPGEEVNITRWWLGRDLSTAACDSAEAKENCTRSAVLEQRARETQMQLILILETLALESTATQPPVGTDTLSTRANWDDGFKKVKKPGKSQDLNMLSDLLVDRLCIWQSMSVDEAKASNNELRSASQSEAIMACEATDSNQLGQFCVDVVLPL